jgi:hypothetical protein
MTPQSPAPDDGARLRQRAMQTSGRCGGLPRRSAASSESTLRMRSSGNQEALLAQPKKRRVRLRLAQMPDGNPTIRR